ncbi:carbohydrate diacid regulator CdaR2 [Acetobacterium woodii DSM 1030]|uniref:Carbohydrate diacid regulator CdaR2 n=2 Tax=Acetobacterium woodii TaxID=33952 RepID=H6LJF7_ACEWD|nr:carbohydrate diacid regulator CdaR2 [Acetobacterium woodii DSM 1030]
MIGFSYMDGRRLDIDNLWMMHYANFKVLREQHLVGSGSMKFNDLVAKISVNIPIIKNACKNQMEIIDIALIDGRQNSFQGNILYFGYSSQLAGIENPPCHGILVKDDETRIDQIQNLALVAPAELFSAVNLARTLMKTSGGGLLYEELIKRANETRDLQAVVNTASILLGNSLIFSDVNFKILAHSTSIPVTDDLWKDNIRQGYCSYDFIQAVQQLKPIQQAAHTTDAVEVSCTESPYRKLSSKVFHNDIQVGFLLMIEGETPVTPVHMEMLEVVSHAISYTTIHYFSYLFQTGTRYQQLLYELLIGAPPENIVSCFPGLEFASKLMALSVLPTRYLGERHLKDHLVPALKEVLTGSHVTYHEGKVAVLVPLLKNDRFPDEQLKELQNLVAAEHLRIGVSNTFTHVESFAKYYHQAVSALNLGKRLNPENFICYYLDYQFYDLLDHVEDEAQLGQFCHPALSILRQYDRKNETCLYDTLKVYLDVGGSIKRASEKLFVHRNSLAYRLERIAEISNIDLNDAYIRFMLRMSYLIDCYKGQDT